MESGYYHSSFRFSKIIAEARKEKRISHVLNKKDKKIILVNLPTSDGFIQVAIHEDIKPNRGNRYYITDPHFEGIINDSLKTKSYDRIVQNVNVGS